MRLKQYIKEDTLNEVTVKSKKDQTGHYHDAIVNADGDGKTTATIGADEDHEHVIYQWLIQPAMGHIHNLEE
jgi:hypothetical protein